MVDAICDSPSIPLPMTLIFDFFLLKIALPVTPNVATRNLSYKFESCMIF